MPTAPPNDTAVTQLASVDEGIERAAILSRHAMAASLFQTDALAQIDERIGLLSGAVKRTADRAGDARSTALLVQSNITQQLTDIVDSVRTTLKSIESEFTMTTLHASVVLDQIARVSKTTHILALNAQIQAVHAGDAAGGFAVVALEVKQLATESMKAVRETSAALDFSRLANLIEESKERIIRQLDDVVEKVSGKLDQQVNDLTAVAVDLADAASNTSVIGEALASGKAAAARGAGKALEAENLLEGFIQTHGVLREADEVMTRLRSHVTSSPAALDLLDEVVSTGVLRIAIESQFQGLSFRPLGGGELTGLDVDYARAFADWLGVDCAFVETPWSLCSEAIELGGRADESPAHVWWSALPPDQGYDRVAFSETYTYLPYVLARRTNDTSVQSIDSLEGRVLGCINDPAAFATLQGAGVRWRANRHEAGGLVQLGNLLPYNDQRRIQDCLADGSVDAFAVDHPIYWWACNDPGSPWHGTIELLPTPIIPDLWYYAVGVLKTPRSLRLLTKINEFISWFATTEERQAIEMRWQGRVFEGSKSYRDEPGGLVGEDELRALGNSGV